MKLDLDADSTALLPRLPPILACGNARNSALQAASSGMKRRINGKVSSRCVC